MHDDLNVLDLSTTQKQVPIYVMDRGYLDFERLLFLPLLHEAGSFFVTRANCQTSRPKRQLLPLRWIRSVVLICDQTVILSGYYSHKGFPS